MPETARRNLTPRIARMLRELEGAAPTTTPLRDATEARLARKQRGPAHGLVSLMTPLPADARHR